MSTISNTSKPDERQAGLEFCIQKVQLTTPPKGINLILEFKNRTTDSLRLFTVFEPLGVFFSMSLVDNKGTNYDMLRGGKADIPLSVRTYTMLKPGGVYRKELSLSEILTDSDLKLSAGRYTLKMVYHNQYGENCVKGRFESNELEIEL